MKEFEILVSYMRECDQERDYYTVVKVIAENQQIAEKMVDEYLIEGMFDRLENDYIEDTAHVVKTLESHEVK